MICPICKLRITYLNTLINEDKTLSDYYYCLTCHKEYEENIAKIYEELKLEKLKGNSLWKIYIKSNDSKFCNPYGHVVNISLAKENKPLTILRDYKNYTVIITAYFDGVLQVERYCKYKDLNSTLIPENKLKRQWQI